MKAINFLLKQQKFSRNVVLFCLTWLCFYTITSQILFYFFQIEMQFLTDKVFSVFGGELLLLMTKELFDLTIKICEMLVNNKSSKQKLDEERGNLG